MFSNTSRCVPAGRESYAFASPLAAVLNDPRLSPFFSSTIAKPRDRGTLALDVSETEAQVLVRASLPGYSRENVAIEVEDGVLSITATPKETPASETEQFHHRERRIGPVSRAVRLPAEVDDSAITAELKDGELTLRLPKVPAAQPRRLDIL